MTTEQEEIALLDSLRNRRGKSAFKWAVFIALVCVTYTAFLFGLVLTIARIDGEFVGEVCQWMVIRSFSY